jgi:AraC-like DNA-binding protein
MTDVRATPLQYLERALGTVRELGLMPERTGGQEAPITALLARISSLDEEKVVAIARTLDQASLFNDIVRQQVGAMDVAERYEAITNAFNSIRDDARRMVEQIEDGKLTTFERLANVWMKVTRGDVASRFDAIKRTFLDVTRSTLDQVERERRILDAYQDFRGALKQAEILALEVLRVAEGELATAKRAVTDAGDRVTAAPTDDLTERARLELARDERVRALQSADERYQIAKDLSDNLTVAYHTSEVIMARLLQTTHAKERVHAQSVSFFSTNETVLTALSASFTGMFGLHESTRTIEAMKEGVGKSLEDLAEIGGKVQEAALRAGYGPTVRADAVKKLVEAVVAYQTHAHAIVEEMRAKSTANAREIQEAVEDGKRRLALLAEQAAVSAPAT